MAESIALTLEEEGYQVSTATSAVEAVSLAAQLAFDLVISDIRMEGMDGLQALERMKAESPDVSTMVITGFSTEADSLRALQLGVGDYLKKPFTMAELTERVKRLLADRHELDYQSVATWAVVELAKARGIPPAEELEATLKALGAPFLGPGPSDVTPEGRARGLLSLGRALEQSGDYDNAERAYRSVPPQTGALLSLARLYRRQNDADRVLEAVREAQPLAEGPQAAAEAQLWGGLYLLRGPHHAEALGLLQAAQQRLVELGLLGLAACACVASAPWTPGAPVESALKTLLQHTAELTAAAPYLPLQELKSSEALEQVLAKLGQEPILRLFSTGAFEVYFGDQRVDEAVWKGQKNKFLLACIASGGGRQLPDERVVEEFWPGGSLGGKRNLNNVLYILRKGLNGKDYVLRTPGYLALNPALPRWHDLEEIEECLKVGTPEALKRASSLYRGPYLEGCYMEFAITVRTRLETAMAEGLWKLAAALEPREAVEQLQRLLEIDPCHQDAYRMSMQHYLAAGRPEEAVRVYKRCEKMLAQELQMEPSIDLVELYQRARLSL